MRLCEAGRNPETLMSRKIVKGLRVLRPEAEYLVCGCGVTSVKIRAVGYTKARCEICGEFGFYPRLYNCRFGTELTGQHRGPR